MGYLKAGVFFGDTVFAGSGWSKLYLLWTFCVCIVNFVQFTYTAIFPIVVNVGLTMTDTIMVVLGLGILTFFSVRTERDLYHHKGKSLDDKKRILLSRATHNAVADRVLFTGILLTSTLTTGFTWVYAYGGGGVGLNWVYGSTASPTAYNYPLTSTRWGALTAQVIELVTYRSYVHLWGLIQAVAVFVLFGVCNLIAFISRRHLHTEGLVLKTLFGNKADSSNIPLVEVKSVSGASVSADAYGRV